MNSTPQMDCLGFRSVGEHVDQRYAGALKRYLSERRYATHTVNGYLDCVAHFFQWAKRSVLDLAQIDETVVAHFLNDHLAHCNCGWPTRSDRADSSAALGHLLLVLRTLGITAARPTKLTPVDEELRRFVEHMDGARGLAPKTRRMALRVVRELLRERFRDRPSCFRR